MPRMRLRAIVGTLGMAVVCAQPALGVEDQDFNFKTTEDLYRVCSVDPEAVESVPASFACRGFIGGAIQYHDALTDRKHLKRLICYPKTATFADARAAFVAWAGRNAGNQSRMNEVAVVGLVRALAETYPCQ